MRLYQTVPGIEDQHRPRRQRREGALCPPPENRPDFVIFCYAPILSVAPSAPILSVTPSVVSIAMGPPLLRCAGPNGSWSGQQFSGPSSLIKLGWSCRSGARPAPKWGPCLARPSSTTSGKWGPGYHSTPVVDHNKETSVIAPRCVQLLLFISRTTSAMKSSKNILGNTPK